MAEFNPKVAPTGDPNYLGYSHPISQPQPNQTLETLFKGVGNLATEGLKAGAFLQSEDIKDTIYKKVDANRAQFTEALNMANEAVRQGKTVSSPGADLKWDGSGTGTDLFDDGGTVPAELKSLPQTVENISSAKANGKLSMTEYIGKVDKIAKELRTRYPGQRELIDSTISTASGIPMANAYIRSVMSDLNSFINNKDSAKDKDLNFIRSHAGLPDADSVFIARSRDIIGPEEVAVWAHTNQRDKSAWELENLNRQTRKGRTEEKRADASDAADLYIAKRIDNAFTTSTLGAGLSSPEKVVELLEKVASGQISATDKQLGDLPQYIQALKNKTHREIVKEFTDMKPGMKSTYLNDIGGMDVLNKKLNESSKIFDNITELLTKGDFGMALKHVHDVKAIAADTQYGIVTDETIGGLMARSAALEKFGPETHKQFIRSVLLGGGDNKIQGFFEKQAAGFMTQPDLKNTGEVKVFTDAIQAAKASKIRGVDSPKTYEAIINQVEMITKVKSDEAKMNYARAAFDRKNLGMIEQFKRDGVDEKGNSFPGQYFVYRKFSTPEISQEMKRLGDIDPKFKDDYLNWTKESFGLLFRKELLDMKDFQSNPNISISYDYKNKEFKSNLNKPLSTMKEAKNYTLQQKANIDRVLYRVGMGLSSLKDVAKTFDFDVDSFLLHSMDQAGFSLTDRNLPGIPNEIMRSLINARAKKDQQQIDQKKLMESWGVRQ